MKTNIDKRRKTIMKKVDRIGEVGVANNGQKMAIIAYRRNDDIDVQFDDGTIVKNKAYSSFLSGAIANPNFDISKRRIGETSIATNGQKITIIAYRNTADIDVQFEDGTIVINKSYDNFKRGRIKNPNYLNRIEETNIATNGQKMTIIGYRGSMDIDVQFDDGTIVKNKAYSNFKLGSIKNPNYMSKRRIGETNIAKNGQKMTIIGYRGSMDIDVQFDDGTIVKNKAYSGFLSGAIANPNRRIGETSIATNGQKMTIIGYRGSMDIDVQFDDGTIVKNKAYSNFKLGSIKNPNFKNIKKY